MEKNISLALDILSLVFLAVSFGLAVLRKKHKELYSGYIIAVVCCIAAMILSDIVYVCFSEIIDRTSMSIAFGAETVYLAANTFVIYYWADYIGRLILENDDLRTVYRGIYSAVATINIILLVINTRLNIVFEINEYGKYVEKTAGIIAFSLLNYISVVAATISVLRYKDKLQNSTQYNFLLLFQLPAMIGDILIYVYPSISFVCGYAISAVLVLSVFEQYSSYREIDRIIDAAIKEDRFEIYYQPIYSLKDERFVGCEALIRLFDPKQGAMSPIRLIKAAEETGKIHTIGRNNFYKICDFIASPEFADLGIKYVNINMSMLEMEIENVTGRILKVAHEKGISPQQLCIEITETTVSSTEDVVIKNMEELNSAGIAVALDDFGQGHSNLYRMFLLPFKMVKLDQFLIQRLDVSKARIIIENVMTIFKNLDLTIVAEAVETEEQKKFVESLGADLIQGYYYARPMPKDEFVRFIKDHQ